MQLLKNAPLAIINSKQLIDYFWVNCSAIRGKIVIQIIVFEKVTKYCN